MKKKPDFTDIHFVGRLWTALSLLVICAVPAAICVYFGVWPDAKLVLAGILKVGIIYIPIGIIEAVTFAPILGSGASYLAFITGNLTNLKIPCALNAVESAEVQSGTAESDILSTLSVAVSTLVTNLMLCIAVLLLVPLTPLLSSPVLVPAFANVIPALFGALGYMFISQNWKIAVLPLVFVAALYTLLPAQTAQTVSGALIPVSVLVTLAGARVLYKRNMV